MFGKTSNPVYVGATQLELHPAKLQDQPVASSSQPDETDIYDIEFSDDDDQQVPSTLPSSVPSQPPAKKLKPTHGFNITPESTTLLGIYKITKIVPKEISQILIREKNTIVGYRHVTVYLSDDYNHGSVTLNPQDVEKMLEKHRGETWQTKLNDLINKIAPIELVVKKTGECWYWSFPNPEKLL